MSTFNVSAIYPPVDTIRSNDLGVKQENPIDRGSIEGTVIHVSPSSVTVETEFGWCILPLAERDVRVLQVGLKVNLRLDDMRVASVR